MENPDQVDMVDNYLHLCEGGVFLPIDLSPKQFNFFKLQADEAGVTLSGYFTSMIPLIMKYAEDEIAKRKEMEQEDIYPPIDREDIYHAAANVEVNIWHRYPNGWEKVFNGCQEPCNMLIGPCCCGATHEQLEYQVTDERVTKGSKVLHEFSANPKLLNYDCCLEALK